MGRDERRAELCQALVSRILPLSDLLEVGREGSHLLVRETTPYNPQLIEAQFTNMLLTQMLLRMMNGYAA